MGFLVALAPIISLVTGAASAAVGVASAVTSGIAQSQALSYQAQVAAINAGISEQNATSEIAAGQNAEQIQKMKTGNMVSQTTVDVAAHGVDVGSDSAQNLVSAEKLAGSVDAMTIRYNAARAAYGYDVQAWQYKTEGQADKQGAHNALIGAALGGLGSFLGGASSLFGKAAQFKAAGVFGGGGGGGSGDISSLAGLM